MDRKTESDFGIAFGGGAARGLAHIGVIRYLEEQGLKASMVSGTSMGSIIGSLYAFGMTSQEMRDVCAKINYFKLLDINFKKGLLAGKRISAFFQSIFGDARIEDLKMPLRIVSTSLKTGEKHVFKEGRVVDAIRSSISIPGVIMPNILGADEYVDGGLINNLPVEEIGVSNVLAISVLRDVSRPIKDKMKLMGFELKHNLFGLSYQILQKSIDIMMKQNEDRSIMLSGKSVIYLHPKFPGIDYYEFNRFDELISIGYNEAKELDLAGRIRSTFVGSNLPAHA